MNAGHDELLLSYDMTNPFEINPFEINFKGTTVANSTRDESLPATIQI
jgi:hypothetical protein